MGVDLTLDTRELRAALQLYSRATKKDEAEILNHAALNICIRPPFGAVQNTPKANAKQIQRDLVEDYANKKTGKPSPRVFQMAAKNLSGTKGKKGKRGKTLGSQTWQKRIAKESKRIIGSRKRAVGYMASGWIKAARAFGFQGRGAAKFAGANTGYGIKARVQVLVAEVANTAKNITKVKGANSALQRAVNGAARDMTKYAEKKLDRTAKKYSGR